MTAFAPVSLRKLVSEVSTWNPLKPGNEDEAFEYIDLSAIDQELKAITGARTVQCAEAPSRARQLVQEGDVLVSTVRPNLNGVAMVPPHLDGATASTGFCVIRANRAALEPGYVFHWVKSPAFVLSMVAQATGASYPAVSDRIVLDSEIPLPPLSEQRRIVAILDKADALRTKRREALAQLDRLAQSMFVEMFGDPKSNPLGWPTAKLEDVATKITDGEHLTPERKEHGIKLLSARNIQDGYLAFGDVDYVDEAEYQRISKRCKPEPGDVLISCSGSIGRVAPVETKEPLALVRSAALVKPNYDKVTTRFLEMWLRTPFMNREMLKSAKSSSQANLFQGPIRGLPILLPPRGLQLTFDRQIAALRHVRDAQRSSALRLKSLFASLQNHAFQGEV